MTKIAFKMERQRRRIERNDALLRDIETALDDFKKRNFFKKVMAIISLIEMIKDLIKQAQRVNQADMLAFPDPSIVKK